MPAVAPADTDILRARETLDQWVRELMQWHFSPETGSPFWLEWAAKAGWDPRREVKGYADLGYVLEDKQITQGARKWIDAVLASQEADGWFGPLESTHGRTMCTIKAGSRSKS